MSDLLWIFAAINVGYLVYALLKNKKSATTERMADHVRILTVPEELLSIRPVAKMVNIKDTPVVEENWWEKKIQGQQGKSFGRRSHAPEQLLLSDTDQSLR